MSEGSFGDVVAVRKPKEVSMVADGKSVRVNVRVPFDAFAFGSGVFHVDADPETARRMVDGEVTVLVAVSDGDGA